MKDIWHLLNKETSLLSVIAISLAVILVYCMFQNDAMAFFISLAAILASSATMMIYWFVYRNSLPSTERWGILISVLAWLAVFYYLVHAEGLTIMSYFG